VRLEIETRDEFSAIVGLAAFEGGDRPPVSTVRLGEANLMGHGVYSMAQWRDGGPGYRDAFVMRVVHYQLFGRPYQLAALGERRIVGGQWGVDVSHPVLHRPPAPRVAHVGRLGAGLPRARAPGPTRNAIFYDRAWANAGGLVV
jgi:hypothetical protein